MAAITSAEYTTVVKLRRKGGQVVQGCDIYIGRALTMGGWHLPASIWGNPYPVKEYGLADSLLYYQQHIRSSFDLWHRLPQLEGKVLGCWCCSTPVAIPTYSSSSTYPDIVDTCHGLVLVRLLHEYRQLRQSPPQHPPQHPTGPVFNFV